MRDVKCFVIVVSALLFYSANSAAGDDWIRLNLDLLEDTRDIKIFGPAQGVPHKALAETTTRIPEQHPMMAGAPRPKTLALSLQTQRQYPFGIIRLKLDRSMRIRGWEVREKTYVGQTKIGTEWGVGVLFVRKTYTWGVNNTGVSFVKRF